MYYPNIRQEKRLQRKGFRRIAGIDEAGRGSWAGPIVAACVILDPKIKIKGIKDSKLLRAPDRQKMFDKITDLAINWAVAIISHTEIDKMGINNANILAMEKAFKKISPLPDYLLIDAFKVNTGNILSASFIKGDYKITSIAAASIVAKVSRDNLMDQLDEQYPEYGFKHHKGYGTNHHWQMIMEHGICSLHRQSFKPMKDLINS